MFVMWPLIFVGLIICAWLLKGQADFTFMVLRILLKSKISNFYKEKVVWITGCSSGIGERAVYRLAQTPGVKLVLSARRRELLEKVKIECIEKYNVPTKNILVVPLDLMETASLAEKVATVIKYFGKIDVLINNAGRSQRANFLETTIDVDIECYKLNTLGPVALTRLVIPEMKKRGKGVVTSVSSLAGIMGAPLSNSYSGAKHALNGFMRTCALEHRSDNIDVLLFCPGFTFSPNNPLTAFTSKQGEENGEQVVNKSFLHLDPDDCANALVESTALGINEVWYTKQPILLLGYLRLFSPFIAGKILKLIGPDMLKKLRPGYTAAEKKEY